MSVNNLNQQQARTREEYKKAKHDTEKKSKDAKKPVKEDTVDAEGGKNKRIRIRLIPIWLRLLILVVLIFVSLVAGAAVGYGMLGDGKVADIFKSSTWSHIRDLVEKK